MIIIPFYQVSRAALYILVKILEKISAHVTELNFRVARCRTESRQGKNSTSLIKIKELKYNQNLTKTLLAKFTSKMLLLPRILILDARTIPYH